MFHFHIFLLCNPTCWPRDIINSLGIIHFNVWVNVARLYDVPDVRAADDVGSAIINVEERGKKIET